MASAVVEMLTLSHCRKMVVFNTDVALDFDTDTEPLSAVNGAERKRMLSETEDDQEKGHVKKRRKQSKPVKIASESLSDGESHTENGNPDNSRPLCSTGDDNNLFCNKSSVNADVNTATSNSNDHDFKVNPCDEVKVNTEQTHDQDELFGSDDGALLPMNLTNTKTFTPNDFFTNYTNTPITEGNNSQPLEKSWRVNDLTVVASCQDPGFDGTTSSPLSLPSVKPSPQTAHTMNNCHQSGSPVRIFNPEAFCDLCNKEFCNKYFLKTHKANKHGIYSENLGPSLIDSLPSLPYINYFTGVGEVLPSNNQISRSILRKPQLSVSLPQQQNGVFLQKNIGSTNGTSRAFCNICQREFCNKYFVRRHKAKIHGIIDTSFPDTPPGTSEGYEQKNFNSNDQRSCVGNHEKSEDHEIYSTFSGLSIVPANDSERQENRFTDRKACSSTTDRHSSLRQNRDFDSDECISPGMPKSMSPIQTLSTTPIHRQEVIDKETDSGDKQIKRFGITNSEAFCDICRKEYCNKYFLKTHKMRSHGIAQTEWENREDRMNNQTVPLNLIVGDQTLDKTDNDSSDVETDGDTFCKICGQKFRDAFLLKIHTLYVHPRPAGSETEKVVKAKHPVKSNSGSVASNGSDHLRSPSISVCDICQKRFVDILSLETHIETEHASLLEEANDNVDSPLLPKEAKHQQNCPSCQRQFSDIALLEEHMVECHGAPVEHTPIQLASTEESTKQITNSNLQTVLNVTEVQTAPTSSFCEICKKELCNKYFMKTHMQRMHGISIDNGAHIGGVVCDICNKELCSKYFLRVHKQNSHGIVDEILGLDASRIQSPGVDPSLRPSEQSDLGNRYFSHFTEVCGICSRRFRSMKWLKAHLLNDHGDEGKDKWKEFQTHYEFRQLTKYPQEIYKSDSTCSTNFMAMKSYNEGFAHKPDPSTCRLDENGENRKGNVFSTIFNGKNTNTKQYHCSYCPFATSILAFLFVHERSHVNGSDPSLAFDAEESYEKHCATHSMSEATDSTSCGSGPNQREKSNKPFISEPISRTDVVESESLIKPSDSLTPSVCRSNIQNSNGTESKAESILRTTKYDVRADHEEEPFCEEPKKDFTADERIQSFAPGDSQSRRDVESEHEINVALIQAKELLELIADKTDIPVSFSVPQTQKRTIMQPFVLEDSGEMFLTDVEKADLKKSFLSSIVFLPVTERLKNPVTVSFKLTPTL